MKRIIKKMKKLNFTSVVFLVLSLISSTFAWFAFNNIVNHDMNIDIKAWNVEISEGDGSVSNKLDITLDGFYPGVESTSKTLTISNRGDIDSVVSYKINYLRIFDEVEDVRDQEALLDSLAHNYPFTFNFSLDKNILEKSDDAHFSYSISWPLDSGDDNLDSTWGKRAYDFVTEEAKKHAQDNSYVVKDCISIEIELVVEQFVGSETELPDSKYKFGSYKYLTTSGEECSMGSSGCYKFYVFEKQNLKSSNYVYMIADTAQYFSTESYDENGSYPDVYQILNVVTEDVYETNLLRDGLSPRTMGYAYEPMLYDSILGEVAYKGAKVEFSSTKYPMLTSGDCYWVSSPYTPNLAIVYGENNKNLLQVKNSGYCKNVPVIRYKK